MLNEIILKIGTKDIKKTLQIPVKGITIFVGPNSSGKSLILKEIERYFIDNSDTSNFKILEDCEIDWPSEEQLESDINYIIDNSQQNIANGNIQIGGFRQRSYEGSIINLKYVKRACDNNKRVFCNNFYKYFLLKLDGRTRFYLTDDLNRGDLLQKPINIFQKLFAEDDRRLNVRNLIKDAFGLYFIIDPTGDNVLRIRLSKHEPPAGKEQSLDPVARKFHGEALYIKEASDGIQAYVGIISSVCAGQYKTLLIDEPEAFLHPPLAKKLGYQLSSLAADYSGNLIASTHSSDFIMGCIQSGKPVNIVRLEYKDEVSKARKVDSIKLKQLIEHPLVKSANVLSSLFYDGVIVTEASNDRSFYYEIYDRLSQIKKDVPYILFLNAQNKQTIPIILKSLREFGIPAAAIVDIDIIKDGGVNWTAWLDAANVPIALHDSYAVQRNSIKKLFDSLSDKDMKRDGGIDLLNAMGKKSAELLFNLLLEHGIFVVQKGELESWLPELEIPRAKPSWTIDILKKINETNLMPPKEINKDDVWCFMTNIISWIKDTNRKGIPSIE